MWFWLKEKIADFIDRHLVSQFPDTLPPFCFDCDLGGDACKKCRPYQEWKKDVDKGMECWLFEKGIID